MSKKLQLILLGVFILIAVYVKTNYVLSVDLFITQALQDLNFLWFDNLMKFISQLGYQTTWTISLVSAVLFFLLLKKKKEALIIFISTLGALFLSEFFKIIIARPRPDPNLIYQFEKLARFDSYPSGHVLFAMGFYGILFFLAYIHIRKKLLRNLLLVSFVLVISLMGFSRIYLGSHWFSDILGSYILGLIWLNFMTILYKRLKV